MYNFGQILKTIDQEMSNNKTNGRQIFIRQWVASSNS
jgi:hypothetical protein